MCIDIWDNSTVSELLWEKNHRKIKFYCNYHYETHWKIFTTGGDAARESRSHSGQKKPQAEAVQLFLRLNTAEQLVVWCEKSTVTPTSQWVSGRAGVRTTPVHDYPSIISMFNDATPGPDHLERQQPVSGFTWRLCETLTGFSRPQRARRHVNGLGPNTPLSWPPRFPPYQVTDKPGLVFTAQVGSALAVSVQVVKPCSQKKNLPSVDSVHWNQI